MTNMYFAACGNGDINLATFGPWDWENRPLNILAAFPQFVATWYKINGKQWPAKNTMLDSGAFSAYNSGKVINMDELCEVAKDPYWKYTVGLDVIGDGEASLRNNLEMKKRGLNTIPVFHGGDSFDILLEYKKQFDYIGIGGRPKNKLIRNKWLDQCFARVWPIKIHAFGCAQEDVLMRWPFYSADTASWHGAAAWGSSRAMPGFRIPRKSEAGPDVYDLRMEIRNYLRIEERVANRWRKELSQFNQPEVAA